MGNPLDPGEGPSNVYVETKSDFRTDDIEGANPSAQTSEDDSLCLTDLGVVQHDHDILEDKITRKIELKSDLAAIAKELDILIKRKE